MSEKNPLVSVIVITYNSTDFIIETLFSVYRQTYINLELIVSDDFSSDDTVDKVNRWLSKYKNRFVRYEVVLSDRNTGTSANNNRAIRACRGVWVRGVAGDDLIPDKAIESQINYIIMHPNARIVNGYSINFKEEKGKQVLISKNKVADVAPSFYLLEAKQQYNYLLTHDNIGLTEGTLVERSVYYDVTMYDEKYSLIEDMPFWLNVTKAGIKYHYVDEPTMLYRIHESVVHAGNGRILNKNFVDIKRQVINDMVKPYIPWYNVKCQVRFFIDDLIYFSVFNLFNNSPSFLSKIVLSFFYRIRP